MSAKHPVDGVHGDVMEHQPMVPGPELPVGWAWVATIVGGTCDKSPFSLSLRRGRASRIHWLSHPDGYVLCHARSGEGGMRMIPSAQAQGDAMRKRPVGPPNTGPAPASPFDWPPLAIQASG